VLFWVPVPEIAAALDDLPGATVQVVSPDGGPLPASADEVEFYVPPFFPHRPRSRSSRTCQGCGSCRP